MTAVGRSHERLSSLRATDLIHLPIVADKCTYCTQLNQEMYNGVS